jgi:hypothetical protein
MKQTMSQNAMNLGPIFSLGVGRGQLFWFSFWEMGNQWIEGGVVELVATNGNSFN